MKKKRIFTILLCIIIGSFSVLLTACDTNNNTDNNNTETTSSVSKKPVVVDESAFNYQGLHEINVTPGNTKLLENGVTKYKIVIPHEEEMRVDMAVSELNALFVQSSGVSFDVITDDGLTYNNENYYISIGHTSLAKSYGLKTDFDVLGNSGFVIKTDNNIVYLSGAKGYGFGHIYAVYEFLRHTINYEYYYIDEIEMDRNVKDIVLPVFDVIDVPDFEWRLAGFEQPTTNTVLSNRYRQMRRGDNSFMSNGTAGRNSHTLEGWFRPSLFPDHPDWFSINSNYGDHDHQLCYTCRGNEKEFNALVDETVNYVRYVLDTHKQAAIFNLGQADGGGWCDCPTCTAMKEHYGTNAAAVVKWANAVDDKVQKMIKEEYPGRNFMLSIFAYSHTEQAPARKDEQGNYHPIDDTVILNDDMAIMYAPIYSASTLPASSPRNEVMINTGKAWNACASHMFTWLYDTNFQNYLLPFNSYNAVQSKLKAMKTLNSVWIYNQSAHNTVSASCFNKLKMYTDSNLEWNVNLDYEKLIDDFFVHYFKDSAPIMKKYFDELRIRYGENEQDPRYDFMTMNYDTLKTKYWPKPLLDRWLGYIDEAYQSIEHYKLTNPDLYEKLYDRINLESITIRYLILELYKGRIASDELYSLQIKFKDDCTHLKITRTSERSNAEDLWQRWGI